MSPDIQSSLTVQQRLARVKKEQKQQLRCHAGLIKVKVPDSVIAPPSCELKFKGSSGLNEAFCSSQNETNLQKWPQAPVNRCDGSLYSSCVTCSKSQRSCRVSDGGRTAKWWKSASSGEEAGGGWWMMMIEGWWRDHETSRSFSSQGWPSSLSV